MDERYPIAVGSATLGNFFYSTLVPASFKRSVYKELHHFFGISFAYKTSGYAEYIGIIVLSCQLGKLFTPTNGSTDAFMFVGCDGHTISAAAKKYSKRSFTCFNCIGNGMGKVRIVN